MSDDDRHKTISGGSGNAGSRTYSKSLGETWLLKTNGSPNDNYEAFMKEHIGWIFRNASFVQSISDPVKARAYVDEHIND